MSLWDEPNRGRHHFARQLSLNNKVIWVNRKLDRTDKPNYFIGVETINSNLSVLHTGMNFFPNFIPRRFDEVLNINNIFRLKTLIRFLKKNRIKPDLIWIYDYKAIKVASYFQNICKTLYFCNDFFGKQAEIYEFKLIKIVNYVFSTDLRKQRLFSLYNSNSFFIPHGSWPISVIPFFHKKHNPDTVGYIGTINDTLDTEIFSLILEKTDLKIIIAGPFSECNKERKEFFKKLFKNKRVEYLGNLNKKDIELAIVKIDIGLLPYHSRVNGFPLKFFDYLNLGKPIFSTVHDFEWPIEYTKFINFYKSNQDINSFFFDIYQSWNLNIFKEAIILSENSRWSNRVNEISDKLKIKLN